MVTFVVHPDCIRLCVCVMSSPRLSMNYSKIQNFENSRKKSFLYQTLFSISFRLLITKKFQKVKIRKQLLFKKKRRRNQIFSRKRSHQRKSIAQLDFKMIIKLISHILQFYQSSIHISRIYQSLILLVFILVIILQLIIFQHKIT